MTTTEYAVKFWVQNTKQWRYTAPSSDRAVAASNLKHYQEARDNILVQNMWGKYPAPKIVTREVTEWKA